MNEEIGKEKSLGVYEILSKVISLIGTILLVPVILFFILGTGYLLALSGMFNEASPHAVSEIKKLILELWRTLLPLAQQSLSLIGPILILVVVVGLVKWLAPSDKLSLKPVADNLPAVLAVIILGSICILPVMGREIPGVMSNIALVVVGFYFGKLNVSSNKI